MRAKFVIDSVTPVPQEQEEIVARAVTDGSEENKSFSRWTPSGSLSLMISNPNLLGYWKQGDEFYLDFTKIEAEVGSPT